MSAGEFVNSRYESNSGRIYRCRVQPETLEFASGGTVNIATVEAVDQAVSARSSSSRRSFGCTMRAVTLEFTGTLPDGYSGDNVRIPILQPDFFNALLPGAVASYLGTACIVVSKVPEQER